MIPKHLFFIHLGGTPLPAWAERNVQGWRDLLGPSWWVEVITDASRPAVAFEDAYQRLPGYGAKSDVDRINVLTKYGGVYLDYDTLPIRTLEPLIQSGVEFSTSFTFGNQVETAFIAMAPGHPLGLKFLSNLRDVPASLDYIGHTVGVWEAMLDDYLAPDQSSGCILPNGVPLHRVQGFNQPIVVKDALLMPYQSFHLRTQTPDLAEARALAHLYPHAMGLHEFRGTWRANVV